MVAFNFILYVIAHISMRMVLLVLALIYLLIAWGLMSCMDDQKDDIRERLGFLLMSIFWPIIFLTVVFTFIDFEDE